MIPLAKPSLGEKEAQAARETILSGWVTQGPKVREFEEAFARYVGAKHACAVSNCTVALHLSLLVVGVKPGDIVLTVSHSFIGTANSIRSCGAEPVFVDIDPKTFNMSAQSLREVLEHHCEQKDGGLFYKEVEKVTVGESPLIFIDPRKRGRVSAIMPVHQLGLPCDMKAILSLSKQYNLSVIEDAACALGSEIYLGSRWGKVGKPHGKIACFSFHPRKIITTGDGGMITTNDLDYDQRFRLLRNHGMNISGFERQETDKIVLEQYLLTAFNYRMTDLQAAVGLAQLGQLPLFIDKRRRINELYRKYLKDITWLQLPYEPDYVHTNWQCYPIRLTDCAPLSRNDLIQYLFDHGIASIPGVMNAHREAPYRLGKYISLKESEKAREEVILLPCHVGLTEKDIRGISEIFLGIESKV